MVRSRKRKAKKEEEDVMPKAKRERRSAVQGLIDLGPLLPRQSIRLPTGVFKVTYINVGRQVVDEAARQHVAQQESVLRQALAADNYAEAMEMLANKERFSRRVIRLEAHGHRTTLGELGGIQRAEIHFRAGVGFYEAMSWEHSFSHVLQLSERTHIIAIKSRKKLQWEGGGGTAAS